MKYKYSKEEAQSIEKHGIKLLVYPSDNPQANTVFVEVQEGHFQEFYDKVSTFLYYITEGKGTFYLNGQATPVKAGDQIIAPPNTKIWYLGKMKMVLTTTPRWAEENEVHVRFIDKDNPQP